MAAQGSRTQHGASNLPVILCLLAAGLVLVFVLFLRGGEEEGAASSPVPVVQEEAPSVQQPTVAKAAPAPSREAPPPPETEPERRFAAREPERYEEPPRREEAIPYREAPDYSDYSNHESASDEIPREILEALRHPPEMPESLRLAIERGELNQIPPEYQAALDGPGPQISASELEQLERQATEIYIPPDILEQFEEMGRRMNAGQP